MKVHHALTDGIGGMQLALHLFDLDRNPPPPTREPVAPAGEQMGAGELVRESLVRDCVRTVEFLRDHAESLVPSAVRAARHPRAWLTEGYETVRSIGRTIAPVTDTLSPMMKERSTIRHLDMLEVQLDDLKRAAACADGSLNDGFMAAVSGGLRRYHQRHGFVVDELRVTLPISIRKPDDPPGGNRITLMRFAVPVADADPASRVRAMGRLCRSARDERSLSYVNAIAATLNLLPRVVVAGMLKHVDFVASDIPGFAFPIYLAGAKVERCVAFGPTIGAAVNLSLLSYDGVCAVGVCIDTAAVESPDDLVECCREGFEEVLALGGAHEGVRRPLRDEVVRIPA
jgi:WS/DGAT/MGAT family acyltransferase